MTTALYVSMYFTFLAAIAFTLLAPSYEALNIMTDSTKGSRQWHTLLSNKGEDKIVCVPKTFGVLFC